jgi:hypothetical protein
MHDHISSDIGLTFNIRSTGTQQKVTTNELTQFSWSCHGAHDHVLRVLRG